MQIKMNTENRESIYELVYDEETMKLLISDIIKKCSIRRRTRCRVKARTHNEAETQINSATDWNGNKIYENVSDIRAEAVDDPFDYWRHGDPVPYSFTSDKLVSPQLVGFLISILNGDPIDYEWFTNRKELSKKQEVQMEIQSLDSEINGISNFDTTRKIQMLESLATKMNYLSSIPDFDYDALSHYYSIAEKCINLELVQETIRYQKKPAPPTPNKQ